MSAVLGIVQFQRLGTETGQTLPAGRTADTVQSDAAGVKFRLQFERNLIPEVFLRIILRGKPGRTHGALLVKTGTLSSVSYELRANVLTVKLVTLVLEGRVEDADAAGWNPTTGIQ